MQLSSSKKVRLSYADGCPFPLGHRCTWLSSPYDREEISLGGGPLSVSYPLQIGESDHEDYNKSYHGICWWDFMYMYSMVSSNFSIRIIRFNLENASDTISYACMYLTIA